jgi:hypothetical protein
VPDNDWPDVLALVVAFLIAVVTTPAGVSGAVLLPPFQASVLDTHIMAIAPTNLVHNIIASPRGAVSILAAGADRRPVDRAAHRRDRARGGRRVRDPGRVPARHDSGHRRSGRVRRRDLWGRRRLHPRPGAARDGHPPAKAAPAALASTFVTSVAGVLTFTLLAAHHHGRPPDWSITSASPIAAALMNQIWLVTSLTTVPLPSGPQAMTRPSRSR